MIFPKIFWCYCLLILQVMCRDPPTVKIKDQGMIMGMFMKMYRTQSIVAYLGIPYAHPPVGMLRFNPPVVDNIPSWEGVRNGSQSQPNCFQNVNNPKQKHTVVLNKLLNKVMDMDVMMNELGSDQYDEDCLYLNLFVPDGESRCIDFRSFSDAFACPMFVWLPKELPSLDITFFIVSSH
jgi:carboxylesterase type B